ncbi:RagB/SusD family nutrient uptake outer membrane protein [Segetibacter sp. 3557_3]|uniref:RagB/SusD family nutrient uptake outer membrane protein n=1 Tax=Segetibacter sp. 3557_3 TaxID=2547429 RepID=UPI001058E10F|nr:RagB/SusD family nutrient uptake outer membrane protein [Segetibacter sp. 3557_3]TDH24601.1 RagB/SusD family nutrient uptake outer membrane protein [Segetibacter sp. 3557_3]
MKNYRSYIFILTVSTILLGSCKKFLDLKPIDSPTEDNFYVDEKGLQGGLTAAYDALQDNGLYGNVLLSLTEIRSDNMEDNDQGASGGVRYQIESFAERPDNTLVTECWLAHFKAIYRANVVLSRAPAIQMDSTRKKQIIGEASFLRALNYFNATRLWGKLPLITTPQASTEARNNTRADTAAIYAQIITDLTLAVNNLPTTWPDAQRGRATSFAARGLLAKVLLYQKTWDQVVSTIQPLITAINAGTVVGLVPQPTTFPNAMKTSRDVLFSARFLSGGIGESANQNNRFRNVGGNNAVIMPPSLFEANDNRRALVAPTSAGGERPGKYNGTQVNNEVSMDIPIVRCAEAMLIYAEALNELGYPNTAAFTALNAVRTNAGITTLTSAQLPDQASFRNAVYKERRLELALELDRWFDIVRTGQMPVIFPLVNGFRRYYPVPQTEIQNITNQSGWQNEGY